MSEEYKYLIKSGHRYLRAKPGNGYYGFQPEWTDDKNEITKSAKWDKEKTADRYLENFGKASLLKEQEDLAKLQREALSGHSGRNDAWYITNAEKNVARVATIRKEVADGVITVERVSIDKYPIRFGYGHTPVINEKGHPSYRCCMCGVYLEKLPFVFLGVTNGRICPICVHTLHEKTAHMIDKMEPEHVKAIRNSRFLKDL